MAEPGQREGEDTDPLHHLHGAMIWEADAWAIHARPLGDSAGELLGIDADDMEGEEGFLKRHVHPGDWGLLLETMYLGAAEGGVRTCRHRLIRGDGSMLWAQTSVHRSSRSNGSLLLTGLTVDVSQWVDQERAQLEEAERSRMLVQNLREYAIFMLTPRGVVSSWNAGARKINGYGADEIVGAPLECFFPPDEIEKGTPERLLTSAELDREAEYEGWLVRKGGARFWASLTTGAMIDSRGSPCGFSIVARDLTDRMRIERAVHESEAHFRMLVDSVLDHAVFELSPEGLVQSWNRGARRLKGYRSDEIIGQSISRFWPAEQREQGAPERLRKEAETKGSAVYEGWLVRRDSSQFWALCTLSAVEDEHGRLRGFSFVARDLSDRKRVEDTLREREHQMRLLIDSLRDYAVFMISPDGRITSWSTTAERLKGYTAADIIGAPIARFIPEEEVRKGVVEELLERAAREGRAEYEGWIVTRRGARFWSTNVFNAVRDGEGHLRGFAVVARDVTERMRAERAQAFLAEVGAVLARSLDLCTTCDAVCRLATRDLAAWCAVLLRTDDQLEPVSVAHVDAALDAQLREAAGRVPWEQVPTHGLGGVLHTGKGRRFAGTVDPDQLGTVLGIEIPELLEALRARSYTCVPLVGRGVTFGAILLAAPDDRYAMLDLRMAEELATRAALSIESARLFEEAQNAIRLREDILSVVTHDLRSPLSSIRMGAELLEDPAMDPSIRATLVARIKRAADRMTRMILDLLDFSSLRAGKLRLETSLHDVAVLAGEATDMIEPIARDKGITIERAIEGAGSVVRCDRDRVFQVFSNILTNAIKFTSHGGRIVVRSRLEPGRVVFSIEDTGPGISAADVPYVFERYWRAKHLNRESGVGLGLAISKGIIESHEGSIWVQSQVGQGATFFFALPRG